VAKFRLIANPTFVSKVAIPAAGDQPEGEINFTFRHKSRTQLLDFYERSKAMTAIESLKEIAEAWDVQAEDGTALPFDDVSLLAVLDNYHSAWAAISEKYMLDLTKFKQGN
jgi:Phage tail assembly chaperone